MISYFTLKGLKAKDIYKQLLEASTSKRSIEFWAGEFNRGRTRLEDDPTKDNQKLQPHHISLSKFIIVLVKFQV